MLKKASTAIAIAALFLTSLMACHHRPDEASVKDGALKGAVANDVVAFKGIPFAAPPVGALRWRAPQPEAAWSGMRDATAFGPSCLQDGTPMLGDVRKGEDCLTLNIWAPVHKAAGKLPVMVWITGGGYVTGRSSNPLFGGENFARDGVVLVSFNYRLGRLGFFAHPALTKAAEGPLGNYGLMDQIAALKWIKANIAAFGGDPGNVTVFGESAGATSIDYLLINPQARGLFEKAIAESGFGRSDPPTLAVAEQTGAAFARTLGVDGDGPGALAALRALPGESLLGGYAGIADPKAPRPMLDGQIVAERIDSGFQNRRQATIPLLLGGNSFEASLFARATTADPTTVLAQAGPDRAAAISLFGGGDPLRAAYNISTASLVGEPNRALARADAAAGARVFLYTFSYVPAVDRAASNGAAHGSELNYLFEMLAVKTVTFRGRTIVAAAPADLAMSRAMHAYWIAFARTGDPGSAGGPRWQAYDARADNSIEFGSDGIQPRNGRLGRQLDVIAAAAQAAPAAGL